MKEQAHVKAWSRWWAGSLGWREESPAKINPPSQFYAVLSEHQATHGSHTAPAGKSLTLAHRHVQHATATPGMRVRGRLDGGESAPQGKLCLLTSERLYCLVSFTRVWSRHGTSPYRFFSWLYGALWGTEEAGKVRKRERTGSSEGLCSRSHHAPGARVWALPSIRPRAFLI